MQLFTSPARRPAYFVVLFVAAILIASAAVALASAAHRLTVTQTTGSLGSDAFLNTSATGGALQGEVAPTVNTSFTIPFGMLGYYDAPGSTFGVGVAGYSTTGYAVLGEGKAAQPSILAYALGSSWALEADVQASNPSNAIDANTLGTGNALQAFSMSGTAVHAYSGTAGGVGYLGAPTGEGVEAIGNSGSATHPALTVGSTKTGTDLIGTYNSSAAETYIVQAKTANASGAAVSGGSDVQVSGDLYVQGNIYYYCSSNSGAFPVTTPHGHCYDSPINPTVHSRGSDGETVSLYHSVQTAPTVEGFGQAELIRGTANVRLDRDLLRTISLSSPYMVFITPNGESHGLYVTNKTTRGFEVHENGEGRSTISFDYRIVASPLVESSGSAAGASLPIENSAVLGRYREIAHDRAQSHTLPSVGRFVPRS